MAAQAAKIMGKLGLRPTRAATIMSVPISREQAPRPACEARSGGIRLRAITGWALRGTRRRSAGVPSRGRYSRVPHNTGLVRVLTGRCGHEARDERAEKDDAGRALTHPLKAHFPGFLSWWAHALPRTQNREESQVLKDASCGQSLEAGQDKDVGLLVKYGPRRCC
jgi:hypothetical protein